MHYGRRMEDFANDLKSRCYLREQKLSLSTIIIFQGVSSRYRFFRKPRVKKSCVIDLARYGFQELDRTICYPR